MFKLNIRSTDAPQDAAEASQQGGSLEQRRADAIQARARAAEARPQVIRPAALQPAQLPLAPTTNIVDQRLSEELAYIRRLMDNVAGELAGDPVVVQRHMRAMQSFDLIGQLVGHVSQVLGVADREAAIDRIGMLDLRARLQRQPLSDPLAPRPSR